MAVVPPPTPTPVVTITPTSFQQGSAVDLAWSLTGFPDSETFGVMITGLTEGTFGNTNANGQASGTYPASQGLTTLKAGTYDFVCQDDSHNEAIALLTVTPPPVIPGLGNRQGLWGFPILRALFAKLQSIRGGRTT